MKEKPTKKTTASISFGFNLRSNYTLKSLISINLQFIYQMINKSENCLLLFKKFAGLYQI